MRPQPAQVRRVWPGSSVDRGTRLLLLAVAGAIWAALFAARLAVRADDGLVGEYFANSDLSGAPAFSVIDRNPSTETMRQRWDGVLPERFSVRWTGFITVGRSGLYNFATASDDGSQLFIDNRVVVDNGGLHGLTSRSGAIELDSGSHRVELRYVQFAAVSALDWSWGREGADLSPVPASALTRRRTTYPRVVAGQLVEWGFVVAAALVVILGGWYVRSAVHRDMVIRWVTTQAVPAMCFIAIMYTPWAVGGTFFGSVENTFRVLNETALKTVAGYPAFRHNLDTPQTGEQVLGSRVEEMLAMLRGHGVQQYRVSAAIAENSWVLQQIVASGWPRKLEPDAKQAFVLNTEPAVPCCSVIDRQQEVSLVYCP